MERVTTLRDLITNPPGAYSRQVAARYAIRDSLNAQFRESMMDAAQRRRYKVSVTRPNGDDAILVWVKVPSSKYDVDFDVFFMLTFDEGVKSTLGASVQMYCNSPSWVMTLGYVAAKEGLLIPQCAKQLGRAATEPPSVTNRHEEMGFDKIVYKAIMFLIEIGMNSRASLEGAVMGVTPAYTKDPIFSAESKLFEYERASKKQSEINRKEKQRLKLAKIVDTAISDARTKQSSASQTAKSAKKVKSANSIRSVGSARTAGRKNRH